MELSEGQDAYWCKIRSALNYPILFYRDEGVVKIRSLTTTEKLETFASQLIGRVINVIENNIFDGEVNTDADAELDQPFARARINFHQIITFDPYILSDRIRFSEMTDALGKVNTRKAYGPDHITNKITHHFLPLKKKFDDDGCRSRNHRTLPLGHRS